MIEKLADLPHGVFGMKVGGKLTEEDYREVITPMVEDAIRDYGSLRCLVEIEDDFAGLTPSAVDDDVRLGLHVLGAFDAVAILTSHGSRTPSSGRASSSRSPCGCTR